MASRNGSDKQKNGNDDAVGFEAKLWAAADALRNSMDAAEEVEDDGEPFDQKIKRLVTTLHQQFVEGAKLEKAIRKNLAGLGFGGESWCSNL